MRSKLIGTVLVGLSVAACGNSSQPATNKKRVSPTVASLQHFLKANEGQVFPLYVGKEKKLLSIFFEDGVLYHCTQKDGAVVDKETCKQNPFYGMSTRLRELQDLGAPCVGGNLVNPVGEEYRVAICVAPHTSSSGGHVIEEGELTYAMGNASIHQLFTLVPEDFSHAERAMGDAPSNEAIVEVLRDAARAGLTINTFEVPSAAVEVKSIHVQAVQNVQSNDGLERYLVRALVTSELTQDGESIAETLKDNSRTLAKSTNVRNIEGLVMGAAISGAAARNALKDVSIGAEFEYQLEAIVVKIDNAWEETEARTELAQQVLKIESIQGEADDSAAENAAYTPEQVSMDAAEQTAVDAAEAVVGPAGPVVLHPAEEEAIDAASAASGE